MKNIIANSNENEKTFNSKIDTFFKDINLASKLLSCNFIKRNGYSIFEILKYLFLLIFRNKNHYRSFSNKEKSTLPKDTVYKFLNNPKYNWRKLISNISYVLISMIDKLTSKDRASVFIIDDTVYSKNRSKKLEMISWIHDHSSRISKSIMGFQMTTLLWSDGNSNIPVDFTLNTSNNKKFQINGVNSKIDLRKNSGKRRAEAYNSKIESAIQMIKRALKQGIKAKYILFDSWYAYPSTILRIVKELKQNVICRVKNSSKIYYKYKGKGHSLEGIYKKLPFFNNRKKYINSVIAEIDRNGERIKVKIVFARNKNSKKSKWIALLSTNINLTSDKIIAIYGKRWNIEIFFKMAKNLLKLEKEFEGRSYDMLISHTSITFLRYMFLEIEKRNSEDPRTIGNMFYDLIDEIKDIDVTLAIKMIMNLLEKAVNDIFGVDKEKVNKLIDYFIGLLPNYIKESCLFMKVES